MLDILNQSTNWDKLFTSGHARSIHRYSVTNPSISYFSNKNSKTMFLESHAEFNYALLLERDCGVIRFQSQPFSFNYAKNRRYTPDFIEDRGSYLVFVEVKPEGKILNNKELEKYLIIKELCYQQGLEFSIQFISHNNPVIKLQRRLHRFHAHDTGPLFENIPSYLGTIKNLIQGVDEKDGGNQSLCAVYAGLFKGEIAIKSHDNFSLDTVISWGN